MFHAMNFRLVGPRAGTGEPLGTTPLKGSVMVVYLVTVDFRSNFTANSQFGSDDAQCFHEFANESQCYS